MTKITEKWLYCHDCESTTVYYHLESYSAFGGQPTPNPEDYSRPVKCERCRSTKLEIADPITKKPYETTRQSSDTKIFNDRWLRCGECSAITHRFEYSPDTDSLNTRTDICERCGSHSLQRFSPKTSKSS